MSDFITAVDKLLSCAAPSHADMITLLSPCTAQEAEYLRSKAQAACQSVYGRDIYIRGLIEFTDYCKNDCLYCGIRRSNTCTERYRMGAEQILRCCREGYKYGFRTFVLQGGEDAYFDDDRLCEIVMAIKAEFSDCAVTLSVGERSRQSYERLRLAGADRYLLRHETASKAHYERLHPPQMSYDNRLRCLHDLKELGYQTGCGFMVGSPYQTLGNIAQDLLFVRSFEPQMVGIGPFIPHSCTPFAAFPAGSAELTLRILSIVRLLLPRVLLPATTALATLGGEGRLKGILSGANVVMPNLSPAQNRAKYTLYDNKASFGAESAQGLALLQKELQKIGYSAVTDRGDCK